MADPKAVRLDLDVAIEADVQPGDVALAERVLQRAAALHGGDLPPTAHDVYVSLVLTDDAGIAALNRAYRGVEAPTDVLSFPQHAPPLAAVEAAPDLPLMLGDVVVSTPRAAQQAARYGHSRERELAFLLVHGFLHLLGYDHEVPADAAIMEERQEAILDTLGLRRDDQR